ncbi:unnamed protein product [Prunus brigantina]
MSLKGLELLTKHAEPVESAPETIPEASPPVVQEKKPAEKKPSLLLVWTKFTLNFAYGEKTIQRAFGRKLAEIFDNFEQKPVASGSITQVHGAGQQLKPIVVAVKVRHPGIRESIWRDFVIINLVAKISNFILLLSVCSSYWRKLGVIESTSMAISVLSW